jgi:hypothetical protein
VESAEAELQAQLEEVRVQADTRVKRMQVTPHGDLRCRLKGTSGAAS